MKRRILSVLFAALLASVMLAGCKKNVGTPEDNAVQETEEDAGEEEQEAVSYTHLDVYKRQLYRNRSAKRTSVRERNRDRDKHTEYFGCRYTAWYFGKQYGSGLFHRV